MKKIKKITVETLPNGYSLKFDGMKQQNGFLYFSKTALLEGFMLHIGLEMLDELSTENMQDFLVAAMNWNDNNKCVSEIQRLTALCEKNEKTILSKTKELIRMRKRLLNAVEEVKKIKSAESVTDAKTSVVNAIRAIGTVKPISKKEEEFLNNANITDDNDEEDDDE